jgi:hypothetical protein
MFMCTYPKSEKKFCDNLEGIDPKTMHKWINPYVDALFELNFEVASCNLMNSFFVYMNLTNLDVKRFVGVIDLKATHCLMSVDGADYRVAVSYQKSYWPYKFKKSGLWYEIAICIKTGKMVWWNGPYLPGDYNDNMIFQDNLASELELGERAETDRGHSHSARGGNEILAKNIFDPKCNFYVWNL